MQSPIRYGTATVYIDHYGVPNVFGPTDESAIYALDWVQANADWPLVEDHFLRSIGRGAEFQGEQSLGDDYLDRTLQIPQLARAEYLFKPAWFSPKQVKAHAVKVYRSGLH